MRTQAPGFLDNPKEAELQMKKVREIKSWVEDYEEVISAIEDLQVMYDFAKEGEAEEEEVDIEYGKTLKLTEERRSDRARRQSCPEDLQ